MDHTGQNQHHILDELAELLERRNLGGVSSILLQLHAPLGNLLYHTALFAEPLLPGSSVVSMMHRYAAALAEPGAVDALVERLGDTSERTPLEKSDNQGSSWNT